MNRSSIFDDYGTLTIRKEVATPPKHQQGDGRTTRYRLATLATYPAIQRDDCSELIDRFCEANGIARVHLECEWKIAVEV